MFCTDSSRLTSLGSGLIRLGVTGALMAAAPGIALAQTAAAPTREELQPDKGERAPAPAQSHLHVEGGIERGPCPLASPAYAGVRVNFGHVTFANLSAVSPESLASSWQGFAGRDVPISALCEVRDRAATMLREQGYLAAVQVPPQRIDKGGEVRMDVLIARLVDVQARGDAGHGAGLIAAYLRKLTAEKYFNVHEAERQLLLLRDLPGYDIRLTLRPAPGGAPGEVVGDVLVKRHPVEVFASTQNLGATSTGQAGAFVQVAFNDVTGLGDRTVVSAYNSYAFSRQTVLQISHDFAIGSDGLRLGGKFVWGQTRPSVAAGSFKSETYIGQLVLSYPFVRREALTLAGSGGLEAVDQTVDFGGTQLSDDRLRVLFARLDFSATDAASVKGLDGYSVSEPRLRLTGGLEVRRELGFLGASSPCTPIANCVAPNVPISNALANPQAALVRFDSALEFRPSREITAVIAPRAQYTGSALLAYEQYNLGNYTIGRGLDPGVVQGDSGVGSSFELRYGRLAPRSPKALAIQPYVFFDTAWVWLNAGAPLGFENHVWSAGGGLRGRWGNHADMNLTLAIPLDRAGLQTKTGDVRVLFTLTTRLAPWNP